MILDDFNILTLAMLYFYHRQRPATYLMLLVEWHEGRFTAALRSSGKMLLCFAIGIGVARNRSWVHIGAEMKIEVEGWEQWWSSWGGAASSLPISYGVWRSAVSSPSRAWDRLSAANAFFDRNKRVLKTLLLLHKFVYFLCCRGCRCTPCTPLSTYEGGFYTNCVLQCVN